MSLALAAVLFQAGCGKDNGPSQEAVAPEKTTGARGGGSAHSAWRSLLLIPLPCRKVRTTIALSTNAQEAGQTFTAHRENSPSSSVAA